MRGPCSEGAQYYLQLLHLFRNYFLHYFLIFRAALYAIVFANSSNQKHFSYKLKFLVEKQPSLLLKAKGTPAYTGEKQFNKTLKSLIFSIISRVDKRSIVFINSNM